MTARLDRASAVAAAARSNAEWCDAVCRTHGRPGTFSPDAWTSPRRTPPYYPDAVTLTSCASAARVLAAIDTASPGATVKDSYAVWDLSHDGFDVLFEAEWVVREGASAPSVPGGWRPLRDASELATWESAWAGGHPGPELFRPALLRDPRIVVVALWLEGRVAAGGILFRSDAVVGVSNLFAADGDLAAAWSGCLAVIAHVSPGAPIVGYESGDALAVARAAGFDSTGPLRVWVQREPLAGTGR